MTSLHFILAVLYLVFMRNITCLTKEDLVDYVEDTIAEFKVKLRHAAHDNKRRRKREITLDDFTRALPTAYESQIANITPWASIPSVHPVEIEPFTINDDQYLAVVNFKSANGDNKAMSVIYKINQTTQKFQELQQFPTSGGIDFEYIDMGVEKYAIFLDYIGKNYYGKPTYERWFQMNQFLPFENSLKPFLYRTKVRALGATKVKVFQKGGAYFILTANSMHETGNRYHVKSTMHVKVPYGYQIIQEFETRGAQDVEVFVIDGVRYILFINHEDNEGSVDIYSYVYREKRMHEVTSKDNYAPFGLYQRILTHGGRDFEYFTFDNNHYLIAVNEYTQVEVLDVQASMTIRSKDFDVDSVIYWWSGTLWVEWQRIPTQGGVKATYFLSDFGDPMLVIANSKSQAVIYTYDPLRGIFKPTSLQGLSPLANATGFIPDVRSVHAFKMNNSTYLSVANYHLDARPGYNIFKLSFKKSPVTKLDPTIPEIVTQLIADMKAELAKIKSSLEEMLTRVTTDTVLTRSTEQNLKSVKIVRTNISGTLSTRNLLYKDNVAINPIKKMAIHAAEMKSALLAQEKVLRDLQSKFKDVLYLDTPENITGKKTFTKPLNLLRNLSTNKTHIGGLVDNVDIVSLNTRALRTNVDQVITGQYNFSKDTTFQNLDVDGKINNINTTDLMTKATEQTITSIKHFRDVTISNDVYLNVFTLNDLNVSSIMTLTTPQIITGLKTYSSHLRFNDIDVDGFVKGISISYFHENKVSLTLDETFPRDVRFMKGFTVSSDVIVNGTVDGINLQNLIADLEMSGKDEVITGSKMFNSIEIRGLASVYSINGKVINHLAKMNNTNTFTSGMQFTNVTFNTHLITKSTINGIDLSNQVVFKHSNQQIFGQKTLQNHTNSENDVVLQGKLNSINLTNFRNIVVFTNHSTPVTGLKEFTGGVLIEKLFSKQVNNIQLSALKIGLLSTFPNGIWDSTFSFNSISIQGDTKVIGAVNGYIIPDDFILLHKDQEIHGHKLFVNTSRLSNVTDSVNVVNNYNLDQFLQEAVRQSIEQDLSANLAFMHDVELLKDANISGYLNNEPVSKLVTISTEQNLTGTLELTTDTLIKNGIITRIILVNTTVNEVDISEMERGAVYKDRNQTINGSLIFVAGIDCKQNLSVAGLINGVNLTELMNSTVRISKEQHVYGITTFAESIVLEEELTTRGTINNINVTKLSEQSLKKFGQQTIHGDVISNSNMNSTEQFTVAHESTINNIYLQRFLQEAVRLTQRPISINGSLIYTNLKVDNIKTPKISNIDISNVLLQKSNQSIISTVHFNDISIGSLQLNAINEMNLTTIQQLALKVSTSQNITGNYMFQKDVSVIANMHSQNINNISVETFKNNAVKKSGNDSIYGYKYFRYASTINLVTSHLLNDVNVSVIFNDVVTKSGHHKVCWKKHFTSDTLTFSTNANFSRISNNLINNINITRFEQDGVKLNVPQTLYGTYHFHEIVVNNVDVTSVNGYVMEDEFLLTTSNQTILQPITFGVLRMRENLNADGVVDGVNLTELAAKGVSYYENIHIYGSKTFSNVTAIRVNMKENATINEISVNELVPTTSHSVVYGSKSFEEITVRTVHSQSNVVNGVNIPLLNSNAMNRSQLVQTLVGNQRFLNDLIVKGNITVKGLINGQIVSDKQNYSTGVGSTIQSQLESLTSKASLLCPKITTLLPVTSVGTHLSGIEKRHVIQFSSTSLGAIDSTIINSIHYISIARAENGGCGTAYIMKCETFPYCSVLQTFTTNAPTLEFFMDNDKQAILMANYDTGLNATTDCPAIAEVYIWSTTSEKFEPSQTVNEGLLESEEAPIMKSRTLLKNSMKKNKGLNKDMDVKLFSSTGKTYVLATGDDSVSDYVDVFAVNGTTIGSLKKTQRIKVNNKGKNRLSINKLGKMKVLSVSSNYGKMKLYTFNEDKGKFEYYQELKQSATTVKMHKVKEKHFVSFASPDTGFGLCLWLGASGFQDCTSLRVTEIENVETVITEDGSYNIMGKNNKLIIYRMVLEGVMGTYTGNVC